MTLMLISCLFTKGIVSVLYSQISFMSLFNELNICFFDRAHALVKQKRVRTYSRNASGLLFVCELSSNVNSNMNERVACG